MDFVSVFLVAWISQISVKEREKYAVDSKGLELVEQQELLCHTKHCKSFGERFTGTGLVVKMRG